MDEIRKPLVDTSEHVNWVKAVTNRLINKISAPKGLTDDLIAAGFLGLVEAAERFDPTTGIPFRAYALSRVQGAILDSLSKISGLSRNSYKKLRAYKALADYNEAEQVSTIKLESADDRLASIFEMAANASLVYQISLTSDVGEEICQSNNPSPEEVLEEGEIKRLLLNSINKLPENEKILMKQYYFEQLTFEEIGTIHGMTKGGICKIHKRALKKLQSDLSQYKE